MFVCFCFCSLLGALLSLVLASFTTFKSLFSHIMRPVYPSIHYLSLLILHQIGGWSLSQLLSDQRLVTLDKCSADT